MQRAAWLRRGRGAGTHLSESWVARMGPFGAWKDQPRQRKGSLADADVCCGVWPAFRSAGCIVAGIPGAPGAPCAHGAVVPVKRIGGRARSTGHAVHGGATERDRESSVTARRRCTAAGSACAMGWVRAGDAVVPRITASRCTLQRAATSKDDIILLDVLRRRRSTHKVRGRLRGGGRRKTQGPNPDRHRNSWGPGPAYPPDHQLDGVPRRHAAVGLSFNAGHRPRCLRPSAPVFVVVTVAGAGDGLHAPAAYAGRAARPTGADMCAPGGVLAGWGLHAPLAPPNSGGARQRAPGGLAASCAPCLPEARHDAIAWNSVAPCRYGDGAMACRACWFLTAPPSTLLCSFGVLRAATWMTCSPRRPWSNVC